MRAGCTGELGKFSLESPNLQDLFARLTIESRSDFRNTNGAMEPSLRNREIGDERFLFELYLDTRFDEMLAWGWTDEQMRAFAHMQFATRETSYQAQYPEACDSVLVLEGQAVGRFVVSRTVSELRVVDIAILRQHRAKGFATAILNGLLQEADRARIPVTLHVEILNPIKGWYERLGFQTTAERGGYYLMTRLPTAT